MMIGSKIRTTSGVVSEYGDGSVVLWNDHRRMRSKRSVPRYGRPLPSRISTMITAATSAPSAHSTGATGRTRSENVPEAGGDWSRIDTHDAAPSNCGSTSATEAAAATTEPSAAPNPSSYSAATPGAALRE